MVTTLLLGGRSGQTSVKQTGWRAVVGQAGRRVATTLLLGGGYGRANVKTTGWLAVVGQAGRRGTAGGLAEGRVCEREDRAVLHSEVATYLLVGGPGEQT